jgi:hypothetical protein
MPANDLTSEFGLSAAHARALVAHIADSGERLASLFVVEATRDAAIALGENLLKTRSVAALCEQGYGEVVIRTLNARGPEAFLKSISEKETHGPLDKHYPHVENYIWRALEEVPLKTKLALIADPASPILPMRKRPYFGGNLQQESLRWIDRALPAVRTELLSTPGYADRLMALSTLHDYDGSGNLRSWDYDTTVRSNLERWIDKTETPKARVSILTAVPNDHTMLVYFLARSRAADRWLDQAGKEDRYEMLKSQKALEAYISPESHNRHNYSGEGRLAKIQAWMGEYTSAERQQIYAGSGWDEKAYNAAIAGVMKAEGQRAHEVRMANRRWALSAAW